MAPLGTRLAITVVALLALSIRSSYPNILPSDSVTFALLVLAAFPWAGYLIHTAELPGGWKLKFRELEKKTNELQDEIDRTSTRIDSLFIASMSSLALNNLRKIASGSFGSYYRGQGLTWQLLYFASMGYVSFKCRGVDEIPVNGEEPTKLNLSDYVLITDLGREYLALRELVEKRKLQSKM